MVRNAYIQVKKRNEMNLESEKDMKKQRALIYGAGEGGQTVYQEILDMDVPYDIIAFVDKKKGGSEKNGIPVIFPEQISGYDYDVIFTATIDNTVVQTLISDHGVPAEKINTKRYEYSTEIAVRVRALERFKDIADFYDLSGSTAEVGVYQGDFAKHINRLFPDSTLYLYDTFEGFNEKDIALESNKDLKRSYTHYAETSEDMVLQKMPHPDNVVIRKGLFPETATGENDKYLFVNLDADLYAPILAGLDYFYPKLSRGGTIFVHDYFADAYFDGVRKAVREFIEQSHATIAPIGDYRTLVISKPIFEV